MERRAANADFGCLRTGKEESKGEKGCFWKDTRGENLEMSQELSQRFTPGSLFRFVFPSVLMMAVMSLYTIVDGVCISKFAGSDALSATNIVYPVVNILLAVGIMLCTGGSAYVAKLLGEKKDEEANRSLSLICSFGVAVSVILGVGTILFLDPLCLALGADETLMEHCRAYLGVIMVFAPACMLQTMYQNLLVAAGRPKFGMILTVAAGVANAVLDVFFMGVLHMGVEGASLATGIGQMIPAAAGSLFFFRNKKGLHFCRFSIKPAVLLKSCSNGSSEMVSQLANAIVTVMFNGILMKMAGADGVAAITIILYGQFLFSAVYMGFSGGVSPIFAYQYGAGNRKEIRRLYRMCAGAILLSAAAITAFACLTGDYIVLAFLGTDSSAYDLTIRGFFVFSFNYLFCGFNIFTSGMFTALSDGKNSALVSFARTFGFLAAALLILPKLFGIDGVWLAVPAAEGGAFLLSLALTLLVMKKNYM